MANTDRDENHKKAKQAWRKKPRKFAPKSRLGCKTCKIRRIKCDLTQPFCTKCTSTGRKCDGYSPELSPSGAMLPAYHARDMPERSVVQLVIGGQPSTCVLRQRERSQYLGHGLSPLMMSWPSHPVEEQSLHFFRSVSLQHLNEYHPCESWRRTLMYFAQTVPAVRHAAVALAVAHRAYLEYDPNQPPSLYWPLSSRGDNTSWNDTQLHHYNKAIRLLLNSHNSHSDSIEQTAITLLVCYLLAAYDHVTGNHIQAMAHVRGGVEVSRHLIKPALSSRYLSNTSTAGFSGIDELIRHVTTQIRRLDMQAVMFTTDWIPAALQQTHYKSSGQPPPPFIPKLPTNAFHTFEQAAEHLQILVAHGMNLHYTQQQTLDLDFTLNQQPTLNHIIIKQLESWLPLFENMLLLRPRQHNTTSTPPKQGILISLLRLQRLTAWTILTGYSPRKELGYDRCLPHFRQCVALAHNVSSAHEHYKTSANTESSRPTFTPEVGFLPVLYVIATKCRHPLVRREALGLLRRHTVREAVWDSVSAARVVEKIIEIEEQGDWDEGDGLSGKEWVVEEQAIEVMRGIGLERRINQLSFQQETGECGVARVAVTYQMCGKEDVFVDSIVI